MNDNIPEEHTEKLAIRNIAYGVVLVITLVVGLVGVGLAWFSFVTEEISVPQYVVSENTSSTASSDAEQVPRQIERLQLPKVKDVVSYEAVYVEEMSRKGPPRFQLIAIDSTGSRYVIVEDAWEMIHAFDPSCNAGCSHGNVLLPVSTSTKSNKVFLMSSYGGDRVPFNVSFSYDPDTGILQKLIVSTRGYSIEGGDYVAQSSFVSGEHALSVSGKKLNLLDLDAETSVLLRELPEEETFVEAAFAIPSAHYSLRWLDAYTIEAHIYDATNPQGGEFHVTFPLLRTEIINIP
jgi:hypothetical protein